MAESWRSADIGDLSGRTAVVTGANAGLGLEITRILVGHGARVVMACRNQAKADAAATSVRREVPPGSVEVRSLDLASLASIDRFGAELRADEDGLDLLINNAGLMATDESWTEDGFEMQFGVNHLGHFALTAELMPLLAKRPGSRVVTMSSMGHRMGAMRWDDPMFEHGYQRWPAYFQSKLANLLFTAELHRRLGPDAPTRALAAHPGASRTDLGTEGSSPANAVLRLTGPLLTQPARLGALPAVRAATDPSARGGELYGPRFMVAGPAVRETPSRRARNAEDARRLWDLSEQLTGHVIATSST